MKSPSCHPSRDILSLGSMHLACTPKLSRFRNRASQRGQQDAERYFPTAALSDVACCPLSMLRWNPVACIQLKAQPLIIGPSTLRNTAYRGSYWASHGIPDVVLWGAMRTMLATTPHLPLFPTKHPPECPTAWAWKHLRTDDR